MFKICVIDVVFSCVAFDLCDLSRGLHSLTHYCLSVQEGDEAFDSKNLGECAEVSEERVGDGELLYFRDCKKDTACTIILRGR